MAYLREVNEEATWGMSEEELHALIVEYEKSGDALGLQSERAHMKWAYLMSVSDAVFATAPETKQFFAESAKHPDDRIDDLMDMFDAMWTEAEKAR
jgi:hypothetical protein